MKILSIEDADDQVIPTAETLTKESRSVHQDRQGVDQEQVREQRPLRRSVDEETLYNQTELAAIFKISRNVVKERLDQSGVEHVNKGQGGPKGKKYRLSDVEDILTTKYTKSDRKTAASERKLEAEAELKEIEVGRRRGELIATSDVELGAVQLFRALHTRLVQMCDDTALDLSRCRTRGEVAAMQKETIGKILQELRNNPNNFISKYCRDE